MGEASRRKRERRKQFRRETERARAIKKGTDVYGKGVLASILPSLVAGASTGMIGTPQRFALGTTTGRFQSRVPNASSLLRKAFKTGRAVGKNTPLTHHHHHHTAWWTTQPLTFGLTLLNTVLHQERTLYDIYQSNGDVCTVSNTNEKENLFLHEQPGYELACGECPLSLMCVRGESHWPLVCCRCRLYNEGVVTNFDVKVHNECDMKTVETETDYRCLERTVSAACPLFHNSLQYCHRCDPHNKYVNSKLLRIFAVGGYVPHGRALMGKPAVVKKKLAKKRLKRLYWELLWSAPGVAHTRRTHMKKAAFKNSVHRKLPKATKRILQRVYIAPPQHSTRKTR